MDLGLAGKVVLLTGGSSPIGGPLARGFAAEGAQVALTYCRRAEVAEKVVREIEEIGGQAMAVPLELTERSSVYAAVDAVVGQWSGIDVLVVNASPTGGPNALPVNFEQISSEVWVPQVRAEVEGALHLVQAVLPVMKPRGWGRVVFMSANIVRRGRRGEEAYTARKSALHGLNQSLAAEVFDDGVLCNVVAPGPTLTEGLLPRLPEPLQAQIAGHAPLEAKAILNAGIPHLRFSTVDDVNNVVLFLASAANGNVTGSVISVAGGH